MIDKRPRYTHLYHHINACKEVRVINIYPLLANRARTAILVPLVSLFHVVHAMNDNRLRELLNMVIEHYISKGEPIGSKFLHSLEDMDYAPSTLRKYLNILEKEGLLYQPYNSAWRIPTVQGLSNYLENLLAIPQRESEGELDDVHFEIEYARKDLRTVVETVGEYADGAVVGFLKADEYYYLWINNLLKETIMPDYETTRYLVKFIESKKIIEQLDAKMTKAGRIYYTFIQEDEKLISVVYAKLDLSGYDAMISILGPARTDHKKNILLLQKLLSAGVVSAEE